MTSRDYDVLIATDFRHSGGTTASIAQEIEVQARMGLKTGIIHVGATYLRANPWSERIRAALAAGLAEAVSPHQPVTAHLLVLRHPRVFRHKGWTLAARADHVVMVANQVPRDGARERSYYDVETVIGRLEEELGAAPVWAPIGPEVRSSLLEHGGPRIELTGDDWHNVINADAWRPRQRASSAGVGVIGRHSRDGAEKWPESPTDLLTAYPDSTEVLVRVLGGGNAPAKILERRPKHWHVLPFGSVAAEEFLSSLDVYVYFHHSGMREAFGRAILEALAAGLPVVTHPYLEPLFGDACHYCEPGDAEPVIADLLRNPSTNTRGLELVKNRYDWNEHRRRLGAFLPGTLAEVARSDSKPKRILCMSSNGGGLGHLTRLQAIVRQLPDDYEPMFLTLSTGVRAVQEFGFWCDYVPSSSASRIDSGYHEYLRARIGAALRVFRPQAFLFDGTFAYRGLQLALEDYPHVHSIWSRRAMWKPTDSQRDFQAKEQTDAFDLVIEPGEFATALDNGYTKTHRDKTSIVAPISLLGADETLSREEARAELGIAPGSVAALLNLGAGNINRIDGLGEAIAKTLERDPNVHLFVLHSLIANRALELDEARVSQLEIYPLARVLRAFDFAIAAPGYNSFHELLAAQVPTVFIPNEKTALDDQVARARWGSEHGACLMSREGDPEALTQSLQELLDPAVRERLATRCTELPACEGANQAADIVAKRARLEHDWSDAVPEARSLWSTVASYRPKPRRLLWRVRTLPRWIKRMNQGPPPANPAERVSARTLLVAADLSPDETSVQTLVDWICCHPFEVVVVVPGDLLAPLLRRGLTVELLSDKAPTDQISDRLCHATYTAAKSRAMLEAYGGGRLIFWADAKAGKADPLLSVLG